MEEYKKDDRGRSKAKRLTGGDPHEKVDSSSWTPSAPENAGVKTGARPLTKRLYKKGGKVVGKCEGGEAMKRADRKPRKAGGRTNHLTPDSLINRDVRTANEVREGTKHDGAFKKGGKAGKAEGGYINIGGSRVKNTPEAKLAHLRKTFPNATHVTPEGNPDWAKMNVKDGKKSGGRTHKFGGGMLGSNPVSDQDMMMGKAAGMRKHGGRAHKEGGGSFKNMKTGQEITPAEVQFGDKNGNIPTPPRRQYKSTDDLVQNAPKTYNSTDDLVNSMPRKRGGHVDVAEDKALIKKMVKPEARTGRKHGGNVFSGDSKHKIPGADGGRSARAKGGRTKGKTQVNIIIGAGGHQPQQQSMPNAPVPAPQMHMPSTPQGGPPMPPQGMPPQGMPPQGMPMPRKSGGRTSYPIETGSGGGEARLDKIKAYGLTPPKRK